MPPLISIKATLTCFTLLIAISILYIRTKSCFNLAWPCLSISFIKFITI